MFYDVSKDWIYDSKNDFLFKKDYMKIYKDSLHDSDKLADDDKSVCLNSKFLSATFILTNSCSLECKYCYSQTDRKHSFLKFDNVKGIVDKVIINNNIYLREKHKQHNISFLFVGGGEPTSNWAVLEESVEYIEKISRKIDLDIDKTLVTNGQWISNSRNEWLSNHINYISFSLDGTRAVQNNQRSSKYYDTYDPIIRNIRYRSRTKKPFGIRATITNESLNIIDEIVDMFAILEPRYIQIEPLYVTDTSKINSIYSPDVDIFVDSYFRIREKYNDTGITIYTSLDMKKDVRRDKCFCSYEANENVVVIPGGYLTSCIEVSSVENPLFKQYNVGKISNESIEFNPTVKIKDSTSCEKCILLTRCNGGCIMRKNIKENAYQCTIAKKIFIRQLQDIIAKNGDKNIILIK